MTVRALLVAVSYGGTRYALSGCSADVTRYAGYLRRRGVVEITILQDLGKSRDDPAYPSRRKFLETLAALVRQTRAGDSLVVHLSGHGFEVRTTGTVFTKTGAQIDPLTKECLLLRHDVATPSGNIGPNNTTCAAEVYDLLRAVPPGAHVFMSVDACSAGDMLDLAFNMQAGKDRSEFTQRRNLSREPFDADVVVLTAVRGHKFTWDITQDGVSYGIFTKFLLDIIEDAARRSRTMTYAELLILLQEKFNGRKHAQDPQLSFARREGQLATVWVARNV